MVHARLGVDQVQHTTWPRASSKHKLASIGVQTRLGPSHGPRTTWCWRGQRFGPDHGPRTTAVARLRWAIVGAKTRLEHGWGHGRAWAMVVTDSRLDPGQDQVALEPWSRPSCWLDHGRVHVVFGPWLEPSRAGTMVEPKLRLDHGGDGVVRVALGPWRGPR